MTESSLECFEMWKQFIARWSIENLQKLTLEEYNSLGSKDSFCYWLESKTAQLGSIWGGSAFKFGIFEYNKQNDKETIDTSFFKDEKYKWLKKYGSTALEAFNKIKEIIVKIANAAAEGEFELIDEADLGQVTKWKIAFLYQNQANIKIPCVYKEESLRAFLGKQEKGLAVSALYREILKKNTENKDIFTFSKMIWTDVAEKFQNAWLMAPGENAYLLNDFIDSGMTKIGWNEVGDLSEFATKNELTKKMKESFEEYKDKSPSFVTGMLWSFCHEIKIGDIIFLKKGTSQIIGRGIVKSEYKKLENGEFQHAHDVEWTHIGTWNFSFPGAQKSLLKLNPDKFKQLEKLVKTSSDNENMNWFPSNYDTGITTEKWIELLNNPKVFDLKKLTIMKCLQDCGGQASCKQLSTKYGRGIGFYNSGSSKLAIKIHDITSCNVYNDGSRNVWYAILYQGRYAHNGEYIWKLRPELADALKQVDLSNIDLYSGEEITPDSAGEINFWWLNANPKMWSMSATPIGEIQDYTLYNDKQHKRRIFQNFLDAQVGDMIIGYESTPVKQIVALFQIAKAQDGERIYFKKIEHLASPVDLSILQAQDELAEMEFFKNSQASLLKLSTAEYDCILNLIRDANPLLQVGELEKYNSEHFLSEVFMTSAKYESLTRILKAKKNIILQGAPGVGKTFAAERLAYSMMGEIDKSRIEFVQFHQNYSYEDFIMGYKPNENGFELKKGIFYSFCQKAASNPGKDYFFIIDEINRGNMSKIFGELLMLIEKDYREKSITLAYDGLPFRVPKNLYIIGMMNTADRSLAMIDYALRRRFSFFDIEAGFESNGFKAYQAGLNNKKLNKLVDEIKSLNNAIIEDKSLGKGFCIGHSYLCGEKTCKENWPQDVVVYDILPMLAEYWFDEQEKYDKWVKRLMDIVK